MSSRTWFFSNRAIMGGSQDRKISTIREAESRLGDRHSNLLFILSKGKAPPPTCEKPSVRLVAKFVASIFPIKPISFCAFLQTLRYEQQIMPRVPSDRHSRSGTTSKESISSPGIAEARPRVVLCGAMRICGRLKSR